MLDMCGCIIGRKGIGVSNTISMSNTIKIMASRKNRSENGIRALFLGSNPHSKGDAFSRSDVERLLRNQAAANVKEANINAVTEDRINEDIGQER